MIRIILSGYGRMGRRVAALASATTDIRCVGALEHPGHPDIGKDLGEVAFIGSLGATIRAASEIEAVVGDSNATVLVDFANAEGSTSNVTRAASLGLAIVMGTTGHSAAQMEAILGSIRGNSVAAVISPNMSKGVNVLLEACGSVARMLPDYDVEVLEIHHNQKADAPSGTALKLAATIAQALGRDPQKDVVSGRRGMGKRRSP